MTTKHAYGPMPFQEEEEGLPPGAAMTGGGALAFTGGMGYLNQTKDLKRDKDARGLQERFVAMGDSPDVAARDAKSVRGLAMTGRRVAGAGVIGGLGATMYGMNKLHDHFNKTSSYDEGYELIMKIAKVKVVKAVKKIKKIEGTKSPKKVKPIKPIEIDDEKLDLAVKGVTALPVAAAGLYMSGGK